MNKNYYKVVTDENPIYCGRMCKQLSLRNRECSLYGNLYIASDGQKLLRSNACICRTREYTWVEEGEFK